MPVISNDHLECKVEHDIKIIKANSHLKNLWKYWEMNNCDWSVWKSNGWWPFFSLRPSLNKVDVILNTGYFSEDKNKWPIQFEFEWSLRWIRCNNICMGIFKDISVIRDSEHVPTYSLTDYNKWLQQNS